MNKEQLNAILSDKNSDRACPFCGTNEWIAETDRGDEAELATVAVVSMGPNFVNADGSVRGRTQIRHEAYMMTCTNCGFMRLHNKSTINEMVND